MSQTSGAATAEHPGPHELGDFTATTRVIYISAVAVILGGIGALLALVLLRLIAFFTNLLFFGRLSLKTTSPAGNHLGLFIIVIPIAGALVVGFMARYGSERIRGHGIPEAIEVILTGGSRIQPRVAILKPISSAISIGSGGPFGAEGPIIMTGAAVGSLFAQFLDMTSAERKTLLAAGAAAGMSATFASPVAAVVLAIELLLFELKPRSLVPVAAASATAAVARRYLLGSGPVFPMPLTSGVFSPIVIACCLATGIIGGGLAVLLTNYVYLSEDLFQRLPLHWMWWPALGGLVIGIGGYIYPRALGVGYDVIDQMLQGKATTGMIFGILLVKSSIWAISLGSGTSGGVLAPLMMIGGALGALEGRILPGHGAGFWPVIIMAAVLGGTMRAPITAIIFTVEVTHNVNLLLPLLVGVGASYCVTVLSLKRSILTEKVGRRGFHISTEYGVDPLEILFVREVMRTDIVAIPATMKLSELTPMSHLHKEQTGLRQGLYPVVDEAGVLRGVVTRSSLYHAYERQNPSQDECVDTIATQDSFVAYPDDPLRVVAERMAQAGVTRMLVVDRLDHSKLLGLVSLADLLKGRLRALDEERKRERTLRVRSLRSRPLAGVSVIDD